MTRPLVALVAVALATVASASAQHYLGRDTIAGVRSIIVSVVSSSDQADACIPRPEQLKAEAESAFLRAGLRVVDEDQDYGVVDLLSDMLRRFPTGWEAVPAERQTAYQTAFRNRPHWFTVNTAAVRSPDGRCAASYTHELRRFEAIGGLGPSTLNFGLGLVVAYSDSGVVAGHPVRVGQMLKDHTVTAATTVANEILKARQ